MATPYVKQTWIDNNGANPLSAARLGVIETGIFDAHYRPSVAVYASAQLSIPNNTATIITYNTEHYDTDAMHSTVSNTGRLTAPVAGKYDMNARTSFASNVTGVRRVTLRINGTTLIDFEEWPAINGVMWLQNTRHYLLAAADYVEVVVTQTSGGALLSGAGISDMHFEMFLASY